MKLILLNSFSQRIPATNLMIIFLTVEPPILVRRRAEIFSTYNVIFYFVKDPQKTTKFYVICLHEDDPLGSKHVRIDNIVKN
jgi:hypothetical protein